MQNNNNKQAHSCRLSESSSSFYFFLFLCCCCLKSVKFIFLALIYLSMCVCQQTHSLSVCLCLSPCLCAYVRACACIVVCFTVFCVSVWTTPLVVRVLWTELHKILWCRSHLSCILAHIQTQSFNVHFYETKNECSYVSVCVCVSISCLIRSTLSTTP